MSELTVDDYQRDFLLAVNRAVDIEQDVSNHLANGDLDGASLVLGLSDAKLAAVREAGDALHQAITRLGGHGPDALKR